MVDNFYDHDYDCVIRRQGWIKGVVIVIVIANDNTTNLTINLSLSL